MILRSLRTRRNGACEDTGFDRAVLPSDPERGFFTGPFVELEVVPDAERDGSRENVSYFREYFKSAHSITDLGRIVRLTGAELRQANMKLANA